MLPLGIWLDRSTLAVAPDSRFVAELVGTPDADFEELAEAFELPPCAAAIWAFTLLRA